jgi:hypothetical protein
MELSPFTPFAPKSTLPVIQGPPKAWETILGNGSTPKGLDESLDETKVAPRDLDDSKVILPPPTTLLNFYNTKPEYGEAGPFPAASRETLADEMLPTFTEWANDKWEKDDEADCGFKVEYIAQAIEQMRREFIAGLEEHVSLGQWTGTIETAANYMDDDLRNALHSAHAGNGNPQLFLNIYAEAHAAKFNEPFVIN